MVAELRARGRRLHSLVEGDAAQVSRRSRPASGYGTPEEGRLGQVQVSVYLPVLVILRL